MRSSKKPFCLLCKITTPASCSKVSGTQKPEVLLVQDTHLIKPSRVATDSLTDASPLMRLSFCRAELDCVSKNLGPSRSSRRSSSVSGAPPACAGNVINKH